MARWIFGGQGACHWVSGNTTGAGRGLTALQMSAVDCVDKINTIYLEWACAWTRALTFHPLPFLQTGPNTQGITLSLLNKFFSAYSRERPLPKGRSRGSISYGECFSHPPGTKGSAIRLLVIFTGVLFSGPVGLMWSGGHLGIGRHGKSDQLLINKEAVFYIPWPYMTFIWSW